MANIKPNRQSLPAVPGENIHTDTAPEEQLPVNHNAPPPQSLNSQVEPQAQSYPIAPSPTQTAAPVAATSSSTTVGTHPNHTRAPSATVHSRAAIIQTPASVPKEQPTAIAPHAMHTAASYSAVGRIERRTPLEHILAAATKRAAAPRKQETLASGTNQSTISRSPSEKASKANMTAPMAAHKDGQRQFANPSTACHEGNAPRSAPRTKLEAATDAIVATRIAYQRLPPTNKFEAAGAALPGRFHLPGTPKQTAAPKQSPSIERPPRQNAQNSTINNALQQASANQPQQLQHYIATKHPTAVSESASHQPQSTEKNSSTPAGKGSATNGSKPRSSPLRSPQHPQNQISAREHALRHPGGVKKMFLKQWKATTSARQSILNQKQQANQTPSQAGARIEDKHVPPPAPRRPMRIKPVERRTVQRKATGTDPTVRRKTASPKANLKGSASRSQARQLLPMQPVQTQFGPSQQVPRTGKAKVSAPIQRNINEIGRTGQKLAASNINTGITNPNESMPVQQRQAPRGARREATQKVHRNAVPTDSTTGRANVPPHSAMMQSSPVVQQSVAELRRSDIINQTRLSGRETRLYDSQSLVAQQHAANSYGRIAARAQNSGSVPLGVGSKASPSSSYANNLPQGNQVRTTPHGGSSRRNLNMSSTSMGRPQLVGYHVKTSIAGNAQNVQRAEFVKFQNRTHVGRTAVASPGHYSNGIACMDIGRSAHEPPVHSQGSTPLWQHSDGNPSHLMTSAQAGQTTNMHSHQHTQQPGQWRSPGNSTQNGQRTVVAARHFSALGDSRTGSSPYPNKRRRYAKLLAYDESGIPQSVKMADQTGVLMEREQVIAEGAQGGDEIVESGGRAGTAQYWRNSLKLPSDNKDGVVARARVMERPERPASASAAHTGTKISHMEQPVHSDWKSSKDLARKSMPDDRSWVPHKEKVRELPKERKVQEIFGMELAKVESLARSKYHVKMNVRGRLKLERWLNSKGANIGQAVALLARKMDMGTKITSSEQSVRNVALYEMRNHHLRMLEALCARMGSKRENWTFICNNSQIASVANGNKHANTSVAHGNSPSGNSVDVAAVDTSPAEAKGAR